MKIRAHRETIDEAMETCEEIEPTHRAARDFMIRHGAQVCGNVGAHLYADFPDARIGWDKTYIVTDREGVLGFTDGPLTN